MIEHLGISLSMTEKGDPYENAIAERVNGILKIEFLLEQTFPGLIEAEQAVAVAVNNYNHLRPHLSCDKMTPVMAHQSNGLLKKHWKNKVFKHSQPPQSIS